MKSRITLSLMFAMLILSTPVRADFLTGVLVDLGGQLLGSATEAAVTAVKEAVVPQESALERSAREEREVNGAAERILSQYPEELRDGMRADVVNRLALIYAKYNTIESRQEAIRAELPGVNYLGRSASIILAGGSEA